MGKVGYSIASFACLGLSLGACNKSSSSSAGSSAPAAAVAANPACTLTIATGGVATTECVTFLSSLPQSSINSACAAYSGITSASCSTTNVLGVCATPSNSTQASLTYYSGGVYTDSTAQTDCTTNQSGTYTSG